MKRSQINQIIRDTLGFLDASQFYLPEWSRWTLRDWQANRGAAVRYLRVAWAGM